MKVFATGIFDLFHFGHANAFQQIKEAFPDCTLVVGCLSDKTAERIKRKPIMTYEERVKSISYCKFVDEVIEDPWSPDMTPEEQLQNIIDNNFDFFAHEDHLTKYDIFKNAGKFFKINYTKEISTTEIIKRVTSSKVNSCACLGNTT
jgi:cytidyltransferase-like protein